MTLYSIRSLLRIPFYTVSQKVHTFIVFDNFLNCKPIQIIFPENIADGIWNKLIMAIFNIYSLCVAR